MRKLIDYSDIDEIDEEYSYEDFLYNESNHRTYACSSCEYVQDCDFAYDSYNYGKTQTTCLANGG